jgi:hypothetical protein
MEVLMKGVLWCLFVLTFLFASFELVLGFKPFAVKKTIEVPGEARIEIKEFIPNNYIRGGIIGLSLPDCDKYKVIVYVKTDKWYIHPYDRGGDGLSYAKVNKQCEWRINTIKRDFLADKVTFFLVEQDYIPPSTFTEMNTIKYKLFHIEEGNGRI